MIIRRNTRQIRLGDLLIGGGAPISVQSMTNTDTADAEKTAEQIHRLEAAGCEIIRVAVPDLDAARALRQIREAITIPLIADIHFDWRLAVAAMEHGTQGIRINPGNLGGAEKLNNVVDAAKHHQVPIRVGVNSGSIEKDLLERYGYPTADNPRSLIESAVRNVRLVEKYGYQEMKVSIKSADVLTTICGYRALSKMLDYPLHLGVTEAGGLIGGTVKSSVALGILLSEGIGDTFRISLTRDPVEEIRVAYELLRSLKIRERGPELISCPTCGRTGIDLFALAQEVEEYIQTMKSPLKVAVMGCVVNGPGEAREADIGVAGGRGKGIIFKKGEIVNRVPEEQLLSVFMEELKKMESERLQADKQEKSNQSV
ncbi:MAG: flavodoxin-dependent (E)-4-hydroxy-3-methylbut-2-enyl-diphosphate synthase [Desulfobulbaceae bacterium]|nr:flavodoxin-dependent (E)-4-hydroxy-3-methylbut-2-enyl-diphosphate synthase [Desulfofustis sp.]RZW26462.1 MAG: flavodoxin-dependent (E)-4-hydroxy-3-methylbut-2-enyl-diphosphate synthase [Desulfobulbaceae bacterium]